MNLKQARIINLLIVFGYFILIFMTIFNPFKYGAQLKYTIIPLIIVWVFSFLAVGKYSVRLSHILSFLLILSLMISTFFSNIIEWSPSARSLSIIIVFYTLLTLKPLNGYLVKKIISVYTFVAILAALLLIGNFVVYGSESFSRMGVRFIFGEKDVNYVTAFIMPAYFWILNSVIVKKKASYIFILFLMIFSIFLTGSKTAFLSLVIISFLLFMYYFKQFNIRNKLFMLFTFSLIVLGSYLIFVNSLYFDRIINVDSYLDNIRFDIWGYGLQAFNNNRLLGSGIGSTSFLTRTYTGYDSHNTYLDILGDQGILGITIVILMITSLLRVKPGNFIYMLILTFSFLFPLLTINGYETLTFWLPMILIKHVSAYMVNHRNSELLYTEII